MGKIYTSVIMSVIALIIFGVTNYSVQADTSLPQSSWYAVIWNRSTDTLHRVRPMVRSLAGLPMVSEIPVIWKRLHNRYLFFIRQSY